MLQSGLIHLVDPIGADVGLDVVCRLERIAAAGSHDVDCTLYDIFDLLEAGKGQLQLNVNTSAPETQLLGEFPL